MNKTMKWRTASILCFGVVLFTANAYGEAPFAFKPIEKIAPVEDKLETLELTRLLDAKNWTGEECSMIGEQGADGSSQIRLHIDVDHLGGEKNYPIGWPRANAASPSKIPWKGYDYLQFRFLARTSRKEFPGVALSMRFRGERNFSLEKKFGARNGLKKDEWTTVTLPIVELADAPSISLFGFYISEANYEHKDVVDFTFADFKLVRSNSCTIRSMECKGVVYKGEESLKIGIIADGMGIGNGVPFEISQNGSLLRHETFPIVRGKQLVSMDVSELKLSNGDYTLTAFPQNPEKMVRIGFKVIDSPWR